MNDHVATFRSCPSQPRSTRSNRTSVRKSPRVRHPGSRTTPPTEPRRFRTPSPMTTSQRPVEQSRRRGSPLPGSGRKRGIETWRILRFVRGAQREPLPHTRVTFPVTPAALHSVQHPMARFSKSSTGNSLRFQRLGTEPIGRALSVAHKEVSAGIPPLLNA